MMSQRNKRRVNVVCAHIRALSLAEVAEGILSLFVVGPSFVMRETVVEQLRKSPTHTILNSVNRRATKKAETKRFRSGGGSSEEDEEMALRITSSLVAGAGSGALSSLLCAPLDVVRTRLQVWGDIHVGRRGNVALIPTLLRETLRREGYKGVFRGLGATLLTVPAFWGVYFPIYDHYKRTWAENYPTVQPAWIHMGAAVLAGTVSDVFCNPMFVVRTRLQTEALHNANGSHSISATIKSLYAEGGFPIFWRGLTASLLGLSHVAVQFPVYERLKSYLHDSSDDGTNTQQPRQHSVPNLLLASALSKMSASVLTYPHEVVRSRMMDARSVDRSNGSGISLVATCRRIAQREGWRGFYAGLPVSLVRVIPNTCVTFVTYEMFCQWSREQIREWGK